MYDIVLLATYIWLIGIIIMSGYTLFSYARIKKKVSEAVPIQDGVWMCDRIETPFIFGVLRPKIYLPSFMPKEDIEYVLAHERAHINRRDHWWKPLGFLLLTIYWYNPILWVAYVLLCRDIELACDEKVIKKMGTEMKKQYSDALINCSVPRRVIAACPLAFGEVGVRERIKSVLHYKKPTFWGIVVALIACVVIGVCFLTNPKTEAKYMMQMTIVYTRPSGPAFEEYCFYATNEDGEFYRVIWDDFSELSENAEVLVSYNDVHSVDYPDGYGLGGWNPQYELTALEVIPMQNSNMEQASQETQAIIWFEYDNILENTIYKMELPELPDVKFEEHNRVITITHTQDDRSVKEIGGMAAYCVNGYFCDITQDGVRDLCVTMYFGAGIVVKRIIVYDAVMGKVYQLEDRFEYDYALHTIDGELVVNKTKYASENVVEQGSLAIGRNSKTDELELILVPTNRFLESYVLESGMYLAGVDKDVFDILSSNGGMAPYFTLNTEQKEFRMGQSIVMSSALFGTYDFDGLKLSLSVGDGNHTDTYVLYLNQHGSFVYDADASTLVSESQWFEDGMVFGLMPKE